MTDTATERIPTMSAHDRELLTKVNDVINGEERPMLVGREGANIQFPEPELPRGQSNLFCISKTLHSFVAFSLRARLTKLCA